MRADRDTVAAAVSDAIRRAAGFDVPPDANFFEAGLTSALMLRIHTDLRQKLDLAFPVTAMFEFATRRALAARLEDLAAGRADGGVDREVRHPHGVPAGREVAIVGMACRFPGARDLDEFWRGLVRGDESVTVFTDDELRRNGVPAADRADPDYVAAAPQMPDADLFDAGLFGMTDREAELCDPQIRVFLELCHAAVEHAGHDVSTMDGRVGVYAATAPNTYLDRILRAEPDLRSGANTMLDALTAPDYVASQVSYRLNLSGPSATVLTACSSALVAVHQACLALRFGDCDAALAGGSVVDLPIGHGYRWTPAGVTASDGHCRPFDAAGSGTVFGSGAGVVVLKLLDDAVAAGDVVYAVIRGSAVNNDGGAKVSFSAPSVSGQVAVVRAAMERAGVAPEQIGYVEMHATGTGLGDPIELASLTRAYTGLADGPLPAGSCAVGSVKSNVGHLAAAAGVAGLIKTVLALHRQAIPPTVNVREINPALEIDTTPFTVLTELRAWPRADRPRFAGVTSLGIGGTNAHLVLGEGPEPAGPAPISGPRALVWSARSTDAVAAYRERLAAHLATHGEPTFADTVATLHHGRQAHPVRAALVAGSAGEAVAELRRGRRVVTGRAVDGPAAALLFPGQGVAYGAATACYGAVRAFTIAMDECVELFADAGVTLHDGWADGRPPPPDQRLIQPLLFSVGYALADMWTAHGVAPAAVLGHSLGEVTAAAVAGVFDLPDAVRFVVARSEAVTAAPVTGALLAVAAAPDALTAPAGVAVAAVNGPRQTVLCGPADALDRLRAELRAAGVAARPLDGRWAFHHPGHTAAVEHLLNATAGVKPRPPRIRMYSGRTGAAVTPDDAVDPRFWAEQLAAPVLFWRALDALLTEGPYTVVEAGPGPTLTDLARRHPAVRDGRSVTITTVPGRSDATAEVLAATAAAWVRGHRVDWDAAGQPSPGTRTALPAYPYERHRYWVGPAGPEPAGPTPTPEPVRARPDAGPMPSAGRLAVTAWSPVADLPVPGPSGRTALVLLPREPGRAVSLLVAVQRAGLHPVRLILSDSYDGRPDAFHVRPGRSADLDRVVAALAAAEISVDVVVHGATFEEWPDPSAATFGAQCDAAFMTLHGLARLAARAGPGFAPSGIVVVTTGSVDVSGSEPVSPAKSMLHGLVSTVGLEAPTLAVRLLDIGDRVSVERFAAEIGTAAADRVVALRGGWRWVPGERDLTPGAARPPLRDRGVYVVTGGLGGLGTVVARALAGTGLRPRLALLGRGGPTAADRALLDDLRQFGADAVAIACDVTEAAAVRQALATITARWGPVNGLFHLAGVPGGRMVAFRDDADAAAVLAPKTIGTLHLVEALRAAGPALDLAVLFSSRAGTDGLVGGGDYAAANAFLDGVAGAGLVPADRCVSIAWPVWRDVGMAGGDGPDLDGLPATLARLHDVAAGALPEPPEPPDRAGAGGPDDIAWEGQLSPASHWTLDEHRMGRTPVLPGAAYLDLLVSALPAGPDSVTTIADLVFLRPYIDGRPRLVRVLVDRAGSTRIVSRPVADPTDAWTGHCTARVARAPAGDGPGPARRDLGAVRARLTALGSAGHAVVPPSALTVGPRWHCVRETLGDGTERLVTLSLPAPFHADLGAHPLHPALFDVATGAMCGADEPAHLPFLFERITVYGRLPADIVAHIRRRGGDGVTAVADIELLDPAGNLLVDVHGFTMRHAEVETPSVPAPGGTAAGPPSDRPGLAPALGARLLLDILAADTPPVVLVRPHTGDRPDTVAPPHAVPPAAPVPPPARPAAPARPASDDDLDTRLRRLWAQALGSEPDNPSVDFFDAGGDSLTAVELMARIRAELGAELSIGLLLEARTFDALRALVVDRTSTPTGTER